jgi:ribosome-interacting GTPase 1
VQQVKNIKWFAAHSVRIKDKLAELRAEIQCEMREGNKQENAVIFRHVM